MIMKMENDGGAAFRAHVARAIAKYAYHYHVVKAQRDAYEHATHMYSHKTCALCRIPMGNNEGVRCPKQHSGYKCDTVMYCGRPWCEAPEACVVCNEMSCHSRRCQACNVRLCDGCAQTCPECSATTCPQHASAAPRCDKCKKRRLKRARLEIDHVKRNHNAEDFDNCPECNEAAK